MHTRYMTQTVRHDWASTPTQIRGAIGMALLGEFDGFSTDETDRDGDVSTQVYGTTDDGLAFGFRVTISDVWETD